MGETFMLKPLLFTFGMLALLSGQVLADTVLTEQNLSRLETALPQLAKVQQDDVGSLQHVRFQRHCDWPRHAREVRAQQQGKDYLVEVDKILASHQLTAAMFMELSAKGSWPVLDSLQPVLSITRQTLPFLPQLQRQQAEQFLVQTDNMTTVIGPCLSDADKVALTQQRQRLINLATRLPGSILPAQAANLTP
jgi:hypothetical protein